MHSEQAVAILVADECGKTSNTGSIEYHILSKLIVHILDKLRNLLRIAFRFMVTNRSVVESWQS